MDTTKQLYETEATGWKRGLYDDIQHTFRAPIVNWIWRTTMANYPEFCRYAWGQVKPIFETRAFARTSVAYRDTVLTAVEGTHDLPAYRRATVDVPPAEYAELRAQLATFDVVAPRLAILFETMDRALSGEPVGQAANPDRAATAPFPDWLDAERGASPTMVPFDEVPAEAEGTAAALQEFHGIDEGLPSIYRCLAQWPNYFTRAWDDLESAFTGDGFAEAADRADRVATDHVDALAYTPRLAPADLRAQGFDDTLIEDVQGLFNEFNTGAIETVVPAIHVFAATVDVDGARTLE
ncbi:MAG: halocarboxylic acid dehydrogenase DehI family protein [Halopenitus sp.]